MANSIEAAALFQKACDQQIIEGATSGWMEANAGNVKYSGGREIKIPTIATDGLGNYDRNSGYPRGKVALTYQTKTMTQDRGIEFLLDRIDVDESGFIATAAETMRVFQSENVIPEIDAYRYSTLYKFISAAGHSETYTPDKSTIFSTLKADISEVRDKCGSNTDLVIIMSIPIAEKLSDGEEFQRYINLTAFKQGEISTEIMTLNGIPIIRVPSARLKTAYTFNSGASSFGFAPTSDAKDINWMVCPKTAPIAVSKTDGVKIFDPSQTQGADAWKIEYRKFHDLWVPNKALDAMRASVSA
ncbi:MAG: hypothetical protein ACI4RK_01285 [Oscillospiraceae bacterium]